MKLALSIYLQVVGNVSVVLELLHGADEIHTTHDFASVDGLRRIVSPPKYQNRFSTVTLVRPLGMLFPI